MDQVTEKDLSKLLSISISCENHKFNEDSYPSPSFSEFLGRALTISDIPMQSSNSINARSLRKDPTIVPWEDSIKNFVLDVTSINTKQKIEVCIVLTEVDYKYLHTTSAILSNKYLISGGSVVQVCPVDSDYNYFKVAIFRNNKTIYSWDVEKSVLVSTICPWYIPKQTSIYCHNSSISGYREIINMMPESIWSVSCTISNFIRSTNNKNKCIYVLPVYSCEGSQETRAVSSGDIEFIFDKTPSSYIGKLNYYLKSVRGSIHSSGRCYDCQILYKIVCSAYKSPLSSPLTPKVIKFSNSFLDSTTDSN